MLGREDHRGITGMYTCIFYVFGNCILNDFALVGNSIKLNLFRLGHEFRDDHRELLADFGCHVEETMQLFIVVTHVHGSA